VSAGFCATRATLFPQAARKTPHGVGLSWGRRALALIGALILRRLHIFARATDFRFLQYGTDQSPFDGDRTAARKGVISLRGIALGG
jgi:hypothetical protein